MMNQPGAYTNTTENYVSRNPRDVLAFIRAEMCKDIEANKDAQWFEIAEYREGDPEIWVTNWGTWVRDTDPYTVAIEPEFEVPDEATTAKLKAIIEGIDDNKSFRAVGVDWKIGEGRMLIINAEYDFFSDWF